MHFCGVCLVFVLETCFKDLCEFGVCYELSDLSSWATFRFSKLSTIKFYIFSPRSLRRLMVLLCLHKNGVILFSTVLENGSLASVYMGFKSSF